MTNKAFDPIHVTPRSDQKIKFENSLLNILLKCYKQKEEYLTIECRGYC